MVEFNNVLNAYMFNSPSKERETSSAISNAFLSHQVPAREIPPPAPPSPTFQRGHKNVDSILSIFVLSYIQNLNQAGEKLHHETYIGFTII